MKKKNEEENTTKQICEITECLPRIGRHDPQDNKKMKKNEEENTTKHCEITEFQVDQQSVFRYHHAPPSFEMRLGWMRGVTSLTLEKSAEQLDG